MSCAGGPTIEDKLGQYEITQQQKEEFGCSVFQLDKTECFKYGMTLHRDHSV